MKSAWSAKWRDQLRRRRMALAHVGLFMVAYAISLAITHPSNNPAHSVAKQAPTLMQRMSTVVSQGIAMAHQSSLQMGDGQKGMVAVTPAATTIAGDASTIHDAPTFSPDLSSPQRHFESLQQAAVDDNPANRVMAISGMVQMAQASNPNQRMQVIDALRIAAQDGDPAVAAAGREALQQAESAHIDP